MLISIHRSQNEWIFGDFWTKRLFYFQYDNHIYACDLWIYFVLSLKFVCDGQNIIAFSSNIQVIAFVLAAKHQRHFLSRRKNDEFFSSHQEPKNKKHNFLVLPGMLIDKIKLCVHVFVCLVNLFLSIYNLGSNQSQTRRPTFNNRREHSTNCLIKMTIKMNLLLSTCQTYVHFEFTFIIWNHLFYYQHSHSFENTTQLFDSVFSQCSSMFSFLLLLFSFKRDFTI